MWQGGTRVTSPWSGLNACSLRAIGLADGVWDSPVAAVGTARQGMGCCRRPLPASGSEGDWEKRQQ